MCALVLRNSAGVRPEFFCISGREFGTSLFYYCDVGFFGTGYLGTMAKLGPLANSDSCIIVREVLVKLITYLL